MQDLKEIDATKGAPPQGADQSAPQGAPQGANVAPPKNSPKIVLRHINEGGTIDRWDGKSEHKDGIIAVIGYEDFQQNILMCRFLKDISKHFSKTYFLVPRALVDLFQELEGCDGVFEFEGDVPKVTHLIPLNEGLQSLSLSTDGLPYLNINDATSKRWGKLIPDRSDEEEGLRVGLAWDKEIIAPPVQPETASKEWQEQVQQQAQQDPASLDFLLMSNFLRLPVHQFYSLQMGQASLRNKMYNFPANYYLVDLMPKLTDFNEVAGALSRLDLVISCDNSVAHLAAALGCNVWLLAPHEMQAWYWQLEEKQLGELPPLPEGQKVRTRGTMWYQTMRLIKQNTQGNWVEPLQFGMENLSRLRRQPANAAKKAEGKKAEAKKPSDKAADKTKT